MTGERHPARWHVAVAANGLLVASAFLPWLRRGPGSTLRGHELADTILALRPTISALRSGWLAALWYAIPICGALGWVMLGVSHPHRPRRPWVPLLLGGVALACTLVFATVAARAADAGALGGGAYAALAGGLGASGASLGGVRPKNSTAASTNSATRVATKSTRGVG